MQKVLHDRPKGTPQRDPDSTRQNLLEAAFQEIYRSGFQAASLENILTKARVTKGALYHHFGSKLELGYAVVDELIRPRILSSWLAPILHAPDPIEALLAQIRLGPQHPSFDPILGCPLNNLAQEMSPLDEGFRSRLQGLYREWRDGIANALRRGQETERVKPDLDPYASADFMVAALQGGLSLAKNAQDMRLLESCRKGLVTYLESLRPGPRPAKV